MKTKIFLIIYISVLGLLISSCSRYRVPEPGHTGTTFPLTTVGLTRAFKHAQEVKNYDEAERLGLELLKRAEEHYRSEHPEIANRLADLGMVYVKAGKPDKARPLFERALEIREKLLPPDSFELANIRMCLGAVLVRNPENAKRAENLLSKSLKYIGDEDPERFLSVRNKLALSLLQQEKLDRAEEILKGTLDFIGWSDEPPYGEAAITMDHLQLLYRQIGVSHGGKKEILKRIESMSGKVGENHYLMVPLYLAMAHIERKEKNFEVASKLTGKAVRIMRNLVDRGGRGESQLLADALAAHADSIMGIPSRRKDARDLLQEAIRIRESRYGKTHKALLPLLFNLAWLDLEDKNLQAAEDTLIRISNISLALNLPRGPEIELLEDSLQLLYFEYGKLDKAKDILEAKLERVEDKMGPVHPTLGPILFQLGEIAHRQYRLAEAAAFYQRVLEIRKRELKDPLHPELFSLLYLLGETYEEQQRAALGLPYLEQALKIAEKTHGKASIPATSVKATLVELYRQEGDYKKAVDLCREVLAEDVPRKAEKPLLYLRDLNDMAKIYLDDENINKAGKYCTEAMNMIEKLPKRKEPSPDRVLYTFEAWANQFEYLAWKGKMEPALSALQKAGKYIRVRIQQFSNQEYNPIISFVYLYEALEGGCQAIAKQSIDVDQLLVYADAMKDAALKGDFEKALENLDSYMKKFPCEDKK
ncbi:MAG: tetratricopeptide repeat protein [Candidatus Eremiobacteraeota bacterium]|nr:tetratricopeptide repeat protein [Candidatus Eremiobacteraeota bacterium]